ncbi:MAG: hypothetical protein U9Q73_01790 [Nanoarchaeota archaeon]|nr:hypothetical protein [Nanoarchaeota archaeon]
MDEIEIQCKGRDIIIDGMDPSRVTTINIKLEDILTEPINTVFPLNVDDLNKILDKLEDTTVMLEKKLRDKKDYIKLSSNGESYTLYLLDLELEHLPTVNLRKINYDKKYEINRGKLEKIIEKAKIYSDILFIQYDSIGIQYYSVGQIGEFTKTERMVEKQGQCAYNLTFLKSVVKNTENLFVKPFTLYTKNDHPLHIEYVDKGIEYHQWLAPWVEDSDFDDDFDDEW